MMEILKKFRAVVFGAIALFLYVVGYRQASKNAENRQMKGNLDAIYKAKNARNNVVNIDRIRRLHNKYKR